ncbi:MAG: hypothetical protein ACMUIE_05785 [Thermoplasmatota archaeon]
MGSEILQTVGDDPLSELLDMDRFYGWSRRIARLRSIFERKKPKWPYFLLGISLMGVVLCSGMLVYLLFYY